MTDFEKLISALSIAEIEYIIVGGVQQVVQKILKRLPKLNLYLKSAKENNK